MNSRLDDFKRYQGVSQSDQNDFEMGRMHRMQSSSRVETEYMSEFFHQVEEVKGGVEVIAAASARIREITEERLLAVSSSAEDALSRELGPLIDRANASIKQTKSILEKMEAETEANASSLKASELRIRQNLEATLKRKFGDVAKEYQKQQQYYKGEMQKTVKRQLEIVKPDITNEEVDNVIRSGGTAGVYRSAILKGAADPIRAAYADVADKYQDVLKLEQSVQELHQMFLDFALLTEQQGELLDQIEYQVKAANEYVEDGNRDIEVAIVYQKEIRKRWCCIIVILLIVIGVILFYVFVISGAGQSNNNNNND